MKHKMPITETVQSDPNLDRHANTSEIYNTIDKEQYKVYKSR